MKGENRVMVEWVDDPDGGLLQLSTLLAVGVRGHFSSAACERWVTGTYGAKSAWTADFGEDQFSLGRAFYTHFEQARSQAYFADAALSDARVEDALPGLQASMRALAARFVRGDVRARRGWCGSGAHIFPAGGHAATKGGVIHFDTEGLTHHHLARRGRAITLVAMFQPPHSGGGLRVWDVLYDGRDGVEDDELDVLNDIAHYARGDVVVIDSYRLHQIQPFGGARDRISATLHLAEVDHGHWESWF